LPGTPAAWPSPRPGPALVRPLGVLLAAVAVTALVAGRASAVPGQAITDRA